MKQRTLTLKRRGQLAGISLALMAMTGCETLYHSGRESEAEAEARRRAAQEAMQRQQEVRDREMLKAQTDALQRQLEQLEARLKGMETDADRSRNATQTELDRLRSDVDSMRAATRSLRKEIVDELSREMARLLKSHPVAAPPSRGSQAGWEHKVQSGETLSAIALHYKVPVQRIKQANNLQGDLIRVGQVLFIPE